MARINGTPRNDTLTGTNLSDTIYGGGGNDTIQGHGGPDGLYGESGDDRIWGGTGMDALFGGDGADQLYGASDNDYILGGIGNDFLHGGSGNDRLRGEDGDDRLDGSIGDDNLAGGNGNDTLLGSGNDQMFGNAGNDVMTWHERGESNPSNLLIDGGDGFDRLHVDTQVLTAEGPGQDFPGNGIATVSLKEAGAGELSYTVGRREVSNVEFQGTFKNIESITVAPDTVLDYSGGLGNSTVAGGNQQDLFILGSGNEKITTGLGSDVIYLNLSGNTDFGNDVITDFGGGDFLVILGADGAREDQFVWQQTEVNGSTVLTIDDTAGNELVNLTFAGVTDLFSIKDNHDTFWG